MIPSPPVDFEFGLFNSGLAHVFVGPAGAGKSTVVAKLAARCVMKTQRPVALLSLDAYKIVGMGCRDLEQVACIINADYYPCSSVQEVRISLAKAKEDPPSRLILIDTSCADGSAERLQELRQVITQAELNAFVHLVLPATMNPLVFREFLEKFSAIFRPCSVILTFRDEIPDHLAKRIIKPIKAAIRAQNLRISLVNSGRDLSDGLVGLRIP